MPTIAQAQALFMSQGGFKGGMEKSFSYTAQFNGKTKQIDFNGDFGSLGVMEAMLTLYISEFLSQAAANLNASNSTTTGALEESLNFQVTPIGNGYKVDFTALDYYKFVDKGVQGVKGGGKNTTSPYRFKYVNPSKSHVEAIKKWIVNNNLTALVTDINRYGATRRERKGQTMPMDRAAFVVARSIKKKGIAATNFWQNAFDETFKDFGVAMSQALGRSITVNLEQMKEDLANFKGKGAGRGTLIPTR